MGNITRLEKPLARHVPDLPHPKGGEGTMVAISPGPDGKGEVRLWAKGTNKNGAQRIPLETVLGTGTSASHGVKPSEWGEWVRVEDMESVIMIRADIPVNVRTFLKSLLEERAMYRAWVTGDYEQEFEEFLEQQGKGHLANLKWPENKDET